MGRRLVGQIMGLRDQIAAVVLRRALERLEDGRLEVTGPGSGARREFGPTGTPLLARVDVNDNRAWSLLTQGSVGLGEGYIEGLWESDDLLSLLRICAREMGRFDGIRAGLHRPRSALHRLLNLVPRNTRTGARENIAAHYDLGNDLFEAFLDPRMQYSCGIFEADEPAPGTDGLEQAQLNKLNRICDRLELGPDDHLLEIGTGWGGLAVHAAAEYGCRVTTTTISREQGRYAAQRVARAGLADRVTVLDRDYRDLEGRFDKLVSVEMIEAVGWQYFGLFFRRCAELLRPGGRLLLQAITLPDRCFEIEKATRTFANTDIFPGGCLPSEAVIAREAARAGLGITNLERIGSSYAPTLAAWRQRFLAAWEDRLADRYDCRFKRLWEFYLTYCEAGFRERRIDDVQILFETAPVRSPEPPADYSPPVMAT